MAVETLNNTGGSSPFAKNPWSLKPSGRSMFGHQADSRKQSLPQYSFHGSASRDAVAKNFISSAHVEVDNKCRTGPGHVYSLPNAMDKQVEAQKSTAPMYSFHAGPERLKVTLPDIPGPGTYPSPSALGGQTLSPKRSAPNMRFGTGSREQTSKMFITSAHVEHTSKGIAGPDPGHYQTPGAIGTQQSSLRRSAPAYSLPRTDRLKDRYEELSKTLPAVGSYETWSAIGKQSLSPSKTLPAYAFGSSTRQKEDKRFITSSHAARTLKGIESPANYNHQTHQNLTSFGKQTLASRQSTPSYGFGSSPKLVFKTADTPGPGSYD